MNKKSYEMWVNNELSYNLNVSCNTEVRIARNLETIAKLIAVLLDKIQ